MNPNNTQTMITRRYDIDWLRTLGVLLLVPFHGALVFVQNPNSIVYLKDTANSVFLDRVDGFIHQFHMPLLFILAGMATSYSLNKRGAGQYLRDRVARLLIPALFGIAVLVPPMTYITQIWRGKELTIFQHYANFFTIGPDLNGILGTFTLAHLWFITWLFGYSLITLPLFLLLRRKESQRFLRGLAWFFEKPLLLILPGILLALAAATDVLGAVNPIYYFVVFIFGYFLVTDERYQKAIDRDWPYMVLLGVIFEILRQTWFPDFAEWTLPWVLFRLAIELNRWVWLLGILGLGHRLLNHSGKVLNYLAEAAYPFYILHFFTLTLVSYFVVKISTVIAIKYLLIISITYGVVFLVYEGARRIPLIRFMLGMRINKK